MVTKFNQQLQFYFLEMTLFQKLIRKVEVIKRGIDFKFDFEGITRRLVGGNSIRSHKTKNGEFLKLWNSKDSIEFIP